MTDKKLSTDSYKGVRDFYPEDMAIQRYIFDTWTKAAESFGFERYDASILEPADMYRAKGAENEELVNEQTYTFTDRGDREVTLRPEMTPTVARMVAAKQRELAFPLRWYSIPNLFRYERPQKGRLREHWQLNCDIFGADDYTADIELIALANQIMLNFGATPDQFQIKVNDRALMSRLYKALGIADELVPAITRLNDRKNKIDEHTYRHELKEITGDGLLVEEIILMLEKSDEQTDIVIGLQELGINNVVFDKSLARGFDYYTGTIFEIFETDSDGHATGRSILGGGRYDNLTGMFRNEAVSGVGFGMGDVRMREFLEEKNLLPANIKTTAAKVAILPMTTEQNLASQKIASVIRQAGFSVATDINSRKIDKKIEAVKKRGNKFMIVVGEDEVSSDKLTVKNLDSGMEKSGPVTEIIEFINSAN